MNAEEQEIYEFLKGFRDTFVSVTDISKRFGRGRKFEEDRNWARPVLRRMEMDGLLESNPFGEYRLLAPAASPSSSSSSSSSVGFKQALKTPGVCLADTTIISLEDVQNADAAS
jgi:hypothetical protein